MRQNRGNNQEQAALEQKAWGACENRENPTGGGEKGWGSRPDLCWEELVLDRRKQIKRPTHVDREPLKGKIAPRRGRHRQWVAEGREGGAPTGNRIPANRRQGRPKWGNGNAPNHK